MEPKVSPQMGHQAWQTEATRGLQFRRDCGEGWEHDISARVGHAVAMTCELGVVARHDVPISDTTL